MKKLITRLTKLFTMPRIIAIILIAIAISFYSRGAAQSIILTIAGLILLLTPKEYANRQFRLMQDSFRLKKDYAWAMFYDAAYWVALMLAGMGIIGIIMSAAEPLKGIQFGSPEALNNLGQYTGMMQTFLIIAAIAIAVFWIINSIAYGISRSLIWLALLGKKIRASFLLRFGLWNLAWQAGLTLIVVLLFVLLKQTMAAYALIILALLYTHITTVLHCSYAKSERFKESFVTAFKTGIGKFPAFIHPYCYMLITYILLSKILELASGKLLLSAAFLLFFIFMAWYRTYMRNILRQIR
jgi:hypothetical protein